MTTLTVNTTTDFSAQILASIDTIDFTNGSATTATATFTASQFNNAQISTSVAIDGSIGFNRIVVNGGSIDASDWSISNWGKGDKVSLNGTSGGDALIGSIQNDVITGGGGGDVLNGGAGLDTLFGDAGDDIISSLVGAGPDIIDGGNDTDTLSLQRNDLAVSLTLDISSGGGGLDIGDGTKISNIEVLAVTTGSGNDTVTGGALSDNIISGFGNDTVDGGAGNDFLNSSAGADTLFGGGGNDSLQLGQSGIVNDGGDTLNGGGGSDSASLNLSGSAVALTIDIGDGGGGRDIGGGTTLTSIERLNVGGSTADDTMTGGALSDSFFGDLGSDTLNGAGGGDTINGGDGDDTVLGGNGADNLVGDNGDDTLNGGGGQDQLRGGIGRDLMTGGGGADTFFFTGASDSGLGAARDTIADFVHGTDRINLFSVDAIDGGENDTFTFIGTQKFNGLSGELRFSQSATKTTISADINGDGAADFQILLTGVINLTADDFVL